MSATEHHRQRHELGWRTTLVVSTLALSWLLMQAVHEFGHVLHAWASGGTVVRVVLHPLAISRTDVTPNPHPQFVAWGGAVWGCLIPTGLLAVVRFVEWRLVRHHAFRGGIRLPERDVYVTLLLRGISVSWLARFFAGFCLIANGGYLAVGLFDGIGDAGDLLAHGAPAWTLIAFGVATISAGLWFWHGLGPRLGLGSDGRPVSRRDVFAVLATLLVVVAAELVGGRR